MDIYSTFGTSTTSAGSVSIDPGFVEKQGFGSGYVATFCTSVFKEDNQAVALDCDLSCAESVECNTAVLVRAIQSFLHLDLCMLFI